MNPEPGDFYDNCEVFDAVVRALDAGHYDDARRRAVALLHHIRNGRDEKSKWWLEHELGRHLDAAAAALRVVAVPA